jgi:hypothetical protein
MKNSATSRIEVPAGSRALIAKNSAMSNGDAVKPSVPSRFCESRPATIARSASALFANETFFRFPSTTP